MCDDRSQRLIPLMSLPVSDPQIGTAGGGAVVVTRGLGVALGLCGGVALRVGVTVGVGLPEDEQAASNSVAPTTRRCRPAAGRTGLRLLGHTSTNRKSTLSG